MHAKKADIPHGVRNTMVVREMFAVYGVQQGSIWPATSGFAPIPIAPQCGAKDRLFEFQLSGSFVERLFAAADSVRMILVGGSCCPEPLFEQLVFQGGLPRRIIIALKRVPLVLTQHPTVYDVRRAKAAFSSGRKSHPAIAAQLYRSAKGCSGPFERLTDPSTIALTFVRNLLCWLRWTARNTCI